MSKITTIISREYITRVRKKTFIIMSIIGPLLFVGLMVAPVLISKMDDTEVKMIAVADSSHIFINQFPETEYIKFKYLPNADINRYKDDFFKNDYYGLLYISNVVVNVPNAVILYSDKSPSMGVQMHISNAIEKRLENEKLKTFGIDENTLKAVKTNIKVRSVKLTKTGEEKENNYMLAMVLGYLAGFFIYITIFMSGTQVMRGVIEEKTNRIIEVIISSVKPFQLMMGKIIGVGLVALTQFLLWGVLSIILYTAVMPVLLPEAGDLHKEIKIESFAEQGSSYATQAPVQDDLSKVVNSALSTVNSINFTVVFLSFVFFFFGGYFLYGAIFAAIGSAVDNEADSQQFVLPVTLPLILAMVAMVSIVQNPEGALAYWFSIIPFTSPVIMMVRIPFGVPYSEIVLAGTLLVITFILFTWIAGKIYRTGILMYGKKASWREMFKWLKY